MDVLSNYVQLFSLSIRFADGPGLHKSVDLLRCEDAREVLPDAQTCGVACMAGIDEGSFWQQMQQAVTDKDIEEGIVKSMVFGVVASLLAVWEGYSAIPTAEGVGRATTRTVVLTAITVLIFDFMITATYL